MSHRFGLGMALFTISGGRAASRHGQVWQQRGGCAQQQVALQLRPDSTSALQPQQ